MSSADLTLSGLQTKLRAGELSPADAIRDLHTAAETRDAGVGGYLERDLDEALALAENADVSLPLGGLPIAIKDLINVEGWNTAAASKILDGSYHSPYDATVIRKLREAGAIPFGRTNMDEFAMGSSTENSGTGTTTNPWDTSRIPGGSSGGSAAVVGGHSAFAALGTDTGGSIRQPAGLCGCVGLKPSYGRVSRYGVIAFASSLDQVGPMTRSVEDAAMVLGAISGGDRHDSTCLDADVPDYRAALTGDIKGKKIGIPKEYFSGGADPDVDATIKAALAVFEAQGAELVEISLPHTEYAVATYYIIATAEASANLARFDTVRYGNRVEDPNDLLDMYTRGRAAGFGQEVKRRIILGTYVLSSGYYDAYYLKAQKVRTLIRQDFTKAFEEVDIIASPTSPTPAFKIGEKSQDPLQMYLADIYTIATNLAGICGMTLPCGFVDREGTQLPVGLQLLAPSLGEERLLNFGSAYENATDWKDVKPPLAV